MPVTKTAKRALRGSRAKEAVNKLTVSKLETAVRQARNTKNTEKILKAVSLADRAAKRKVIHKNKANRIKAQMSKLMPVKKVASKKK
jgi:small subunit ribosomal protein S20